MLNNKYLKINGGKKLSGNVAISSSKNSTLPILFASIMTEDVNILNIPKITDVNSALEILKDLNKQIILSDSKQNIKIVDSLETKSFIVSRKKSESMRASILAVAPSLNKNKKVQTYIPGGCVLGKRPIDYHVQILKKMGANVQEEGQKIVFSCKNLVGEKISLKFPSVGATETAIMAAAMAKGETLIINSAKEPEVVDLCNYLISLGVPIYGHGTNKISIQGVDTFKSNSSYKPISDRIEAITFIVLGLLTNSNLKISNIDVTNLCGVIDIIKEISPNIKIIKDSIIIKNEELVMYNKDLITGPYPFFSTDAQPLITVLLGMINKNITHVKENIFDDRFAYVRELNKFGMNINIIKKNHILIKGIDRKKQLKNTTVECTDLRAGAALVCAALSIEGESIIRNPYHIFRGYECFTKKIKSIGGQIEEII